MLAELRLLPMPRVRPDWNSREEYMAENKNSENVEQNAEKLEKVSAKSTTANVEENQPKSAKQATEKPTEKIATKEIKAEKQNDEKDVEKTMNESDKIEKIEKPKIQKTSLRIDTEPKFEVTAKRSFADKDSSDKEKSDTTKNTSTAENKYTYSSGFQKNKEKSKEFKKGGKGEQRESRGRRDNRQREDSDVENVLVCVRRVTKVVKGGRTRRFSAVVAVGDKKGKVGIATGKATEVPLAIDKANAKAKKSMQQINLKNGTIPHQTIGKFNATSILLLPAKPGTGVIAGGSARAILELAGITDIVTKIHGSTNSINVVQATFQGLIGIKTREQIAELRGKSIDEI